MVPPYSFTQESMMGMSGVPHGRHHGEEPNFSYAIYAPASVLAKKKMLTVFFFSSSCSSFCLRVGAICNTLDPYKNTTLILNFSPYLISKMVRFGFWKRGLILEVKNCTLLLIENIFASRAHTVQIIWKTPPIYLIILKSVWS